MPQLKTAILVAGFLSRVLAQDIAERQAAASPSVVSIFLPGADPLPYVASLIGSSNGAQTLAISCAPGVNAATCGLPSSVTVTAGPSTAYLSVSNQEATFIYDCKITGSTAAVCAETFNGNVAYIQTQTVAAVSGSTSSVITETLGATDITYLPVTITAAGGVALTTPTPPSTGPVAPTAANSWQGVNSLPASTGTAPKPASATSMGSTTTKSAPLSTWTGAANKLNVYSNFAAAGLAVVAGLVL